MTDPTPEPEHGAIFTPLDADGHPIGPGRYVPLAGPVKVTYTAEDNIKRLSDAVAARQQMRDFTTAIREVGTTFDNLGPAFASIYDAINALGPAIRPPRSNKAARARAKAAKLRQRRAAMAAPRPWGTDWRETASMLRKSIASIARDGVPCHAVPCIPVTTVRLPRGPIAFVGADQ
jgi:hypothetical protein